MQRGTALKWVDLQNEEFYYMKTFRQAAEYVEENYERI